jgi:hypothetical protein
VTAVAPLTKFVPVRVTVGAVEVFPLAGLSEVSVGNATAALILNAIPVEVPFGVVTVTSRCPGVASEAIVKDTVSCAELETVQVPIVTLDDGLIATAVWPAT